MVSLAAERVLWLASFICSTSLSFNAWLYGPDGLTGLLSALLLAAAAVCITGRMSLSAVVCAVLGGVITFFAFTTTTAGDGNELLSAWAAPLLGPVVALVAVVALSRLVILRARQHR